LRSNCGLRATWPREARRHRGHWSRLLRQKRLSESDLLQKAGAKSKAGTASKKPREEELAKERRRAGRGGQKCHRLLRGEGTSSGRSRGVRSARLEMA
jgi:hypothetical protein